MKKFWKDYVELCKSSGAFMKEHWVGLVVIYLITLLAYMVSYFLADPWRREEVKDWFASKFHKK